MEHNGRKLLFYSRTTEQNLELYFVAYCMYVRVYVYLLVYACMYVCICVYMYVVCMYVCKYVCMYVCVIDWLVNISIYSFTSDFPTFPV